MRHEKIHKCEKMRRDASKIRRLFFDFVPMKVLARSMEILLIPELLRCYNWVCPARNQMTIVGTKFYLARVLSGKTPVSVRVFENEQIIVSFHVGV